MSELESGQETPSIQEVVAELARLRSRVEDLEDARELDAAIQRNADKPLIPWEEAKQDFGF